MLATTLLATTLLATTRKRVPFLTFLAKGDAVVLKIHKTGLILPLEYGSIVPIGRIFFSLFRKVVPNGQI